MPEAILKYNLADYDDEIAHLRAIKSTDMASVLWELAHNTKKSFEWRIESGEITDPNDAIDKFYEKFWELMNENGIQINKLII